MCACRQKLTRVHVQCTYKVDTCTRTLYIQGRYMYMCTCRQTLIHVHVQCTYKVDTCTRVYVDRNSHMYMYNVHTK